MSYHQGAGAQNLNLIPQNYPPFIARKIVLEYGRAKEKLYNVVKKSSMIFEVTFKDPKNKTQKPRIVNLDLKTCTCLRKVYFGYCCSHLFSALLENQENIAEKLPSLVNERWKADCANATKTVDESTLLNFQLFRSATKKISKRKVGKGCFDQESNPSAAKIESTVTLTPNDSETKSLNSTNFLSGPPSKIGK